MSNKPLSYLFRPVALGVAVAMALLAAPRPAGAQEFVKELYSDDDCGKSSEFVVREVSAGTWLMAHDRGDCYSGFMLYTEGSPAADEMGFYTNPCYNAQFTELHVNDMEIVDGKVYFCGYYYNNYHVRQGMVGTFSLADFPNSTVKIYPGGGSTVEKIAVSRYGANGVRLYAIWHTDNGQYAMAEYIPNGSNQYHVNVVHSSLSEPGYDIIDDVVVTDSKVVYAARLSSTGEVTLHYFNRASAFYNYFNSYHTDFYTESPVVLAKGNGDSFTLSYFLKDHLTPGYQSLMPPYYFMPYSVNTVFIDDVNFQRRVQMAAGNDMGYIMDAAVNLQDNTCDVVLFDMSTSIYHVDSTSAFSLTTTAHHYSMGDRAQVSLEYLQHQPGQFIFAILERLIRYGTNDWEHCGHEFRVPRQCIDPEVSVYRIRPFILTVDYDAQVLPHEIYQIHPQDVCTEQQ